MTISLEPGAGDLSSRDVFLLAYAAFSVRKTSFERSMDVLFNQYVAACENLGVRPMPRGEVQTLFTRLEEMLDRLVTVQSMQVADLRPSMARVPVTGEIVDESEVSTAQPKEGSSFRIATVTLRDGTGDVRLNLFDEQINQAKNGSRVRMISHTSSERESTHLNVGPDGTIYALEGG